MLEIQNTGLIFIWAQLPGRGGLVVVPGFKEKTLQGVSSVFLFCLSAVYFNKDIQLHTVSAVLEGHEGWGVLLEHIAMLPNSH